MYFNASLANMRRYARWSLAALFALLVQISSSSSYLSPHHRVANVERTELSGWTEVDKRWPQATSSFFLANEKRHHFIRYKLTDAQLDADDTIAFKILLDYYFDARAPAPTIELAACSDTYKVEADCNNCKQWVEREFEVKRELCESRRDIEINIILHNENDVFAWRSFRIERVARAPAVIDTPAPEVVTELLTTPPPPSPPPLQEEAPTAERPSEEVETIKPNNNAATEPSKADIDASKSEQSDADRPKDSNDKNKQVIVDDAPGPSSSVESKHDDDKDAPPQEQATPSSTGLDSAKPETSSSEPPQDLSTPQEPIIEEQPKGEKLDNQDAAQDVKRERRRRKRQVSDESADVVVVVCEPGNCESTIERSQFAEFARGLPANPIVLDEFKYLISTKAGEELHINLYSERDFSKLDTCFRMDLFMDVGTRVDLLIEDALSPTQSKRIGEFLPWATPRKDWQGTIQDRENWKTVMKCVSDYVPEVRPLNNMNNHLKLILRPAGNQDGSKRVAIKFSKRDAFGLHEPWSVNSYIADVVSGSDTEVRRKFKQSFVIDGKANLEPRFGKEVTAPPHGDAARTRRPIALPNTRNTMQIKAIDARQDRLSIISRWLMGGSPASQQQPDPAPSFVYRVRKDKWIKSITMAYQSANDIDNWIERRVYELPLPPSPSHQSPTEQQQQQEQPEQQQQQQQQPEQKQSRKRRSVTMKPEGDLLNTATEDVFRDEYLNLRLDNLPSDKFRLRITHELNNDQYYNVDHELSIMNLAFGDACVGNNNQVCLNDGQCKPTGASQFECTCRKGYSGTRCEKANPCEMYVGNLERRKTGEEYCEELGAKCVQNIPEHRCIWPDKDYFKCFVRALADGDTGAIGEQQASTGNERAPDAHDDMRSPDILQAKIADKQQTIYIMIAFFAAWGAFSVVIVANMVCRVMKLKRKMRNMERDQSRPSSLGVAGPSNNARSRFQQGRGASKSPPAVISYNNQAFDVE